MFWERNLTKNKPPENDQGLNWISYKSMITSLNKKYNKIILEAKHPIYPKHNHTLKHKLLIFISRSDHTERHTDIYVYMYTCIHTHIYIVCICIYIYIYSALPFRRQMWSRKSYTCVASANGHSEKVYLGTAESSFKKRYCDH